MSKRVLFLVNHDVVIYNFRREIVERLIDEGYDVHISSPYGERIDQLTAYGANYHEIIMDRHGMNPIADLKIILEYKKLFSLLEPDICFGFTIKPNIYGAIAARKKRIPFVATITGLGTSIQNGGIKQKISLNLYRFGLKKCKKVFFQNVFDKDFFVSQGIVKGPYEVLPGSGVNLSQFFFESYPVEKNRIVFSYIGRIMKDKGIDELLLAAKEIKRNNSNVIFRVIGFFDDDYKEIIEQAVNEDVIEYYEQQRDIHSFLRDSHAIIQPSHHEGLSNVLLEAESTGRPVLASDIPGCRETFDEGISGFKFKASDYSSLVIAIERFLKLSHKEKEAMGIAARKKMEKEFNRDVVVKAYIAEIAK